MTRPHFLHVFSTFAPGGPQVRTVTLLNGMPEMARHSILAMDNVVSAAERIASAVDYRIIDAPAKTNPAAAVWVMRTIIRSLDPDLVLTYNWGAIEAVLAARLARIPVVHAEDGFNADEAHTLKTRRILARRVLLKCAYATVVPSKTLERIARERYRLSPEKVIFIPNGVDVERFQPRRNEALRIQLGIKPEDILFGYVGHLRPEKNVGLLIDALVHTNREDIKVLLVGDGPLRRELEQHTQAVGLRHRFIFAGAVKDTAPWYGAMDVFVLSSSTEQMPIALLEAMASGLPALCTNVGDCAILLGTDSPPVIVHQGDAHAYATAMTLLATASERRQSLGAANRLRSMNEYSLEAMINRYKVLYETASRFDRRNY
jgi:L-malate glycosyltransferase